ncbi:MAG: hypothetical protein GXN91_00625 [Epsilonproteobacteria bacterium]|nr:hypothetical protein [Campylobacterota bacterium]
MTYSTTIIFTLIDVILLLALILLSLKAVTSNILEELFATTTIVGSIFAASCLHKPFAKFVYTHITQNVSINFLNSIGIILVFLIFFGLGKYISNFIMGLVGEVPKGTPHVVASIILAFIRYFVIFSVIIYIFHTKTKILQSAKLKYSRGVIYKMLKNSGKYILNISTQSSRYYY